MSANGLPVCADNEKQKGSMITATPNARSRHARVISFIHFAAIFGGPYKTPKTYIRVISLSN
jgi:hypothetical protein